MSPPHSPTTSATGSPSIYPTLPLGELLWPRPHPSGQSLLSTPGLETALNARSAIFRVCCELRRSGRDEILLPAFHCPSAVMPALAAGLKPVYYRIRPDLSVDFADLLRKRGPRTTAVLVIHFFGHETPLTQLQALRRDGVGIIEDWSHSFLRPDTLGLTGSADHFRIYSFWKLLPTLVGGGLLRPKDAAPAPPPPHARLRRADVVRLKAQVETAIAARGSAWARQAFEALELTRLRLKRRTEPVQQDQPDLARKGELYYDFRVADADEQMPAHCRRLIAAADLDAVAKRRAANYQTFALRLVANRQAVPAYPAPPAAVPWVFPVLVNNRDQLDRGWKARGVPLHTFGIYLHSSLFVGTDAETVADARFLADRLLCLSVHQDLRPLELNRACDILAEIR